MKLGHIALRRFFNYDPYSGSITHKEVDVGAFTKFGLEDHIPPRLSRWNARKAGAEAFITRSSSGNLFGRFLGHTYQSNYVAWCLGCNETHGGHVFYINGNALDRRLCNLSRCKPTEGVEERYRLELWPIDTVDILGGEIWAYRGGEPHMLLRSGSNNMADCVATSKLLGLNVR